MAEGKLNKIISGGLEILGGVGEDLGKIVSPDGFIKQALGTENSGPRRSELSEYIAQSGPQMSAQELADLERRKEKEREDELAKVRKTLPSANPVHMRLSPKPPELRAAQQNARDEEEKKALQVEARQQQGKTFVVPTGRQQGKPGTVRRKAVTGTFNSSEGQKKDTRIG